MTTSRVPALALAAGFLFALPASAAVDAFLRLDGIEGASTDVNHKGWMEVSSLQLEQVRTAAASIGSATGGAGAGKVSVHDISVTKRTDKASALLLKHCSNGEHFPTATITMRKAGGTQQEYLVIRLTDVHISNYRTSGASGGAGAMTETFLLDAADATVEHAPPPRAGARLAPGAASAVLVANTPTPTPGRSPAGAAVMPKK